MFKKLIFIVILCFVSIGFADGLTIDFNKINSKSLQRKLFIPFGKTQNSVGVYFAKRADDQNFSVASFLVKDSELYLVDSVNHLLKKTLITNLNLKSIVKIPSQTVDIMSDNSGIYLYNTNQNLISKLQDNQLKTYLVTNLSSPVYLNTSIIKQIINKDIATVSVMKKNDKTAEIYVPGNDKFELNVKNAKLGSFQYLKTDKKGNLHFILEFLTSMNPITVKRFWVKTDKSGKLKSIYTLPISNVYLPFREIQINDNGSIWFLNAVQNGLELLYGE